MTIRLFLSAGIAAASTSFSGQAAAQTSTAGSATIVEPGGVNLFEGAAAPRSAGLGEVTFVLSTQINGSLAVQLPGFVAQASNGGTMLLLDDEGGRSVTGTTMASEALSLSFSSGADGVGPQGSRSAASNITVLLAQYN
jgi:hypothetical protein